MRIAYYEAEYLEECAELLQKVYNNEQWGCHWSEIKSKKYIAELSQIPRFVGFLLLNDEEELIGAALCHERTWWYKDELFIDEFFIDPDSQQRGYGSKLLKYMTKYSKAMESFEKWDEEDMNDAETKYYLEVQTRVNKKLLEVQ